VEHVNHYTTDVVTTLDKGKIHKQTRIKNYLYIFFSGFMTIGIPTVRRQQSSYFLKTLDSLLNCTSKKQFSEIVIVIFLADFNITWRYEMANIIGKLELGIRILFPSGATCLSADCCFSELAL
jgi:hypothetical protein